MGSKSNIESYNLLKKCTQTFLNNNANSARTSDNAVTIAFEEFKKFTATLPLKKEFNKGLKNHVASGLYDPRDKRKSGYFMRNASLLFDTFG